MENLKRYHNSLKKLHRLYRIIGQDIFIATKFRRGAMFYITIILLLTAITFYGVDLLFTNDLPGMTRVGQLAIMVAAIQVLCKFISLADLTMLRPIVDYFDVFYRLNSRSTDKYYAIGERYSRVTERGLRLASAMFIGPLCATFLLAMYDSFRTGTPMHFLYFPFVHQYTTLQLIPQNIFVVAINVVVVMVEPAGDAFIFVIVVSLTVIPAVVQSQMRQLSARLERRLTNVMEIKHRWIHYIVLHQNFNG